MASVELPEAETEHIPRVRLSHPASRCLMFFAEWGHVFVLSGFAAALFLGGWRLPGVSVAEQQSSLRYQVAGAALLQAKCWLIVLAVLWARWVLPRVRVDQMMELCWKYLVPTSFVILLGTAVWVTFVPEEGPIARAVSIALFLVAVAVIVRFILRVRYNFKDTKAQLRLNPFV